MDASSEAITTLGNAMTTADWAIVISLCALAVSAGSFIWNVWSTFIFPKAKVNVWASLSYFDPIEKVIISAHVDGVLPEMSSDRRLVAPSVSISATNHGPGDVTLQMALGSKSCFWTGKKSKLGTLNPYNDYPADLETNGIFSGKLPKTLKVGESISVYFPQITDWFEEEKLKKFGFNDSFGRIHLCKASNGRALKKMVLNPPVGQSR
jgi:hypothetical protein